MGRPAPGKQGGFALTILLVFLMTGLVSITIVTVAAAKSGNERRMQRIQRLFIADSITDVALYAIRKDLTQKQDLSVFYEETESGGMLPVLSSQVYSGESDIDFMDVHSEIQEIILGDNPNIFEFECALSVVNLTPAALKIHNLDKDGALLNMDEYSAGELAPLEYKLEVSMSGGIRLETEFEISGIKFVMLENDRGRSILTLELVTDEVVIRAGETVYIMPSEEIYKPDESEEMG